MKKLLLAVITLVLSHLSYGQTYAYTDSYSFFNYNEATEKWDFVHDQKQYSRFVFLSENYFLVESEGNTSKYDVIESETTDEVTMFTIKESTGKVYYMSLNSENVTFLHKDDSGLYQIRFNIYLWEKQ